MFSGEQSHQLDAKNRIRIPTKFKFDPNETYELCRGTTPCIYVLPKSTVDIIRQQYLKMSLFDEEAQESFSVFMSGFFPLEFDPQGRVLLPQPLREYAKIDKNVITVGVYDRLEIWSEEVRKERVSKKTFAEHMKVLAQKTDK